MKTTLLQRIALLILGCVLCSATYAQPTVAAPAPTVAAEKVKSLYSDAYTSFAGYQYGWWGQNTTYSDVPIEENTTLKLQNFNYLGLEINGNTPLNYSDMTTLHIDIWPTTETSFKITPISTGPVETLVACTLIQGEWNSFDIDITEFTNVNSGAIYQLKFADGTGGELYIDNIYFYAKESSDAEPPTNFTASSGIVTHNSIELKLQADDNSGAVIFDIAYGSESKNVSGHSGVETSFIVTDLEGGTEYTFSITVKDQNGNIGETKTVKATTEPPLAVPTVAAPTPTVAAEKVKSLYSNAYTAFAGYQYGYWSQTTTYSDVTIQENTTLKLEDFNYLGFEINGNTPLDYSDMTTLHIDIWTPNETIFKISPISVGAENLVECTPLVLEQWNSYDIDLTEFTNVDAGAIYQLKIADGTGGVLYIDNIYFYAKEDNPNSTISANDENVKWYVQSGILQILNAENTPVKVVDITGKIVFNQTISANQTNIALSQGIYLLSIADEVFKVIIR